MAARRRLDAELVRRGLATRRAEAASAVEAGLVTVAGAPALKASRLVAPDEPVLLAGPPRRFVSRGGEKLDAALEEFSLDVAGRRALDAGASTGGFTDCLLQAGALEVCAVDVGRGQLHERLRQDPRVTIVDGVNARSLEPSQLPYAATLAVIDVSFISLALVLPAVVGCLDAPWRCLPLVKPQFEAGRGQAPGGVVRDPGVRRAALERVVSVAAELGAVTLDACSSGLPGPAGNREFFLHIVSQDHPDAAQPPRDLDARLDRAVDAAG